jgi:hypothetical protein
MNDIELMRNIDEFDALMWYARTAAYLVVWTMTMKVCMGMVTVTMVLTLYYKVKIIYNQYGTDLWEKRYRYLVFISLVLVILLNVLYGAHLIYRVNLEWEEYFTGYRAALNYTRFGVWWGKILIVLGTFTGIQFGVLTLIFTVILIKFIRLIG